MGGRLIGVGIGGLVLISLLVVMLNDRPERGEAPRPELYDVRRLTFADGPEASVIVRDEFGMQVARYERGTNGFARVLLRTVNRERKLQGVDPGELLEIGRTDNGLLVLYDPQTNVRYTLDAFGSTNADVFAGFTTAAADETSSPAGR